MSAIKDFVTKRKKPIAIVLVIAIAGGAFFVFNPLQSQPTSNETTLTTRNVTLEETSLIETLNVSGTVESTRIVNVTTTSQEKVTEIFVQVGDYVAIGDAIVQLDTTDINEQIADEQERITENREDLLKALNDAVEAANDAHTDAVEAETDRNEAQVFEADVRDEYERAVAAITPFEENYNTANALATELEQSYTALFNEFVAIAQTDVNNAQADVDAKQIAVNTAISTLEQASAAALADPSNVDLATAKTNAENDLNAKNTLLIDAQTALTNAQTALANASTNADADTSISIVKDNAVAARVVSDTALAELNAARTTQNVSGYLTTLTNAEKATESAQDLYEAKLDAYDAALDKQETAQENYSEAGESTTLENLLEQKEDSTVRSETNGVITEINAVVGSSMNGSSSGVTGGSPVAVIQDTDSLIITTSFLQLDVSEIYVGQDVIITSDATNDVEYTGKISQISMTADTVSDGTPAFSAEIAVDAGSDLLIGMSAKASVVIFEKNNIITVPFDAIGQDENGNDVVYRLEADGTYQPVQVTVGDGNDYEVEISGAQINVGDVIRASAIAEEALMMSGTESMMFNMGVPTTGGATGGGPGGGGNRG